MTIEVAAVFIGVVIGAPWGLLATLFILELQDREG